MIMVGVPRRLRWRWRRTRRRAYDSDPDAIMAEVLLGW